MNALQVMIGAADARTADAVPAAARHLREAFAERHVPLPLSLARSLAQMMPERQPAHAPFWGRAFARMAQALDVTGASSSQAMIRSVMDRFLLVVAEPILRRAARMAGVLPLSGTGADPHDARGWPLPWQEAEARVIAHADSALADVAVMGAAFWVHAALDLHLAALIETRARARVGGSPGTGYDAGPGRQASSNTECDPQFAALVFLHPPRFDPRQRDEALRRKGKSLSAWRRSGIRPKEGGVAGIRQSRSPEDLPDSLFSELILPRTLLVNKLLHEGLLVRHRPPRREPRRDLLALTLSQALPEDGMGLLVKAAWADAAIRLRVALHQIGLGNSDLVWSETAERPAAMSCVVDEPGVDLLPPLSIDGKVRADMLLRTGLFPEFAIRQTLPPETGPLDTAQLARKALAPAGAGAMPGRRKVAAVSDYGRRFALVARPVRRDTPPDWADLRAEIAPPLERDLGRTHVAAVVWQGASRGLPPRVVCLADGRPPLELALEPAAGDESATNGALAGFIGQLVHWMMQVTLEALDVGQA